MTNVRIGAHAVAQSYSTRYVWYVVSLLCAVNAINYIDRMALAVLIPSIKADLQLSDSELGLLLGFSFSLCYAACGIPIGRWADRGVRRNIIALALMTWSVMTALCGAARNFWQLFAARVGVGVGEAGCTPPAQSLICDYVPVERRSGMFALYQFGVFAGMMIGMALAGGLGETIGWRMTFVALGLPGIAFAMLVRLTLREPPRGCFDTAPMVTEHLSFGAMLAIVWRCRTYRSLVIFAASNAFVQFGLNQWWPSFYQRLHGASMSSIGISLGLAIGVGSGVGLLIGGLLANKLSRQDVGRPLALGAIATSLAIPTALSSLFCSSVSASIVLVSLTALLWTISNGPATAALYSVIQASMRATAGAIAIFLVSVIGFGLGPYCVGLLSDRLAPLLGTESLRYALLVPIGVLPVMVVALRAASRSFSDDLRAAAAVRT